MKLKIFTPSEILLGTEVQKITAEGLSGAFGLYPHHIDLVEVLEPGILSYATEQGKERFVALDQGILIKQEDDVFIATMNAIPGKDLGSLKSAVEEQFLKLSEGEKKSRSALARLEADFIRRFLEQEKETV